ncbi:hypothetical protein GYMLUDRAFT_673398 [Collybiopsis luxurians FD-317 M1]|uniref:Uncharacterized protein n=1 Tax=Collybiopsis luxurians FD-317 M1 TaxID=944289 RepID=A0A0D0BVN9_9AGAR|nr:hypothetical protein GYMLUDRAFT_673398 [Collybiopsis luxurians FD-317 M1]
MTSVDVEFQVDIIFQPATTNHWYFNPSVILALTRAQLKPKMASGVFDPFARMPPILHILFMTIECGRPPSALIVSEPELFTSRENEGTFINQPASSRINFSITLRRILLNGLGTLWSCNWMLCFTSSSRRAEQCHSPFQIPHLLLAIHQDYLNDKKKITGAPSKFLAT